VRLRRAGGAVRGVFLALGTPSHFDASGKQQKTL
jgi:hypothetical protein